LEYVGANKDTVFAESSLENRRFWVLFELLPGGV